MRLVEVLHLDGCGGGVDCGRRGERGHDVVLLGCRSVVERVHPRLVCVLSMRVSASASRQRGGKVVDDKPSR